MEGQSMTLEFIKLGYCGTVAAMTAEESQTSGLRWATIGRSIPVTQTPYTNASDEKSMKTLTCRNTAQLTHFILTFYSIISDRRIKAGEILNW